MADIRDRINDLEARVARLEGARERHGRLIGRNTLVCKRIYRIDPSALAWERGTTLRIPPKPKILKKRSPQEIWQQYSARKSAEKLRLERFLPWL